MGRQTLGTRRCPAWVSSASRKPTTLPLHHTRSHSCTHACTCTHNHTTRHTHVLTPPLALTHIHTGTHSCTHVHNPLTYPSPHSCTCTHTHGHPPGYTLTHSRSHTFMLTYSPALTFTHPCTLVDSHATSHSHNSRTCTHLCKHAHSCTRKVAHSHTQGLTHILALTCTHTHTHLPTRNHQLLSSGQKQGLVGGRAQQDARPAFSSGAPARGAPIHSACSCLLAPPEAMCCAHPL